MSGMCPGLAVFSLFKNLLICAGQRQDGAARNTLVEAGFDVLEEREVIVGNRRSSRDTWKR